MSSVVGRLDDCWAFDELRTAGISIDRLSSPHRADLATLAYDELTTVIRLKRLGEAVAAEEEIDDRTWWGGSIF